MKASHLIATLCGTLAFSLALSAQAATTLKLGSTAAKDSHYGVGATEFGAENIKKIQDAK